MKERIKIPALVSLSREIERSLGGNEDLSVLREKALRAKSLARQILRGRGLVPEDLSPASQHALAFLERFGGAGKILSRSAALLQTKTAAPVVKAKSLNARVLAIYEHWKRTRGEDADDHATLQLAVSKIRSLLEGRGKAVDLLRREVFHAYSTLEFLSEPPVFSQYLEKKKFVREWSERRGMNPADFEITCGPYLYWASPEKKNWLGWFQKKDQEEGARFRIHPYLLALPETYWSPLLASLRGEMIRRGERKLLRGVSRHPLVVEARRYLESQVDFRRSLPWKTECHFHDM
ncbi:MAG: hypothetical protein JNM63_03915 [Spirochaetia bacterium]|nr:hypothetical protein [Spirochaetia bacterium]